MWTAASGAAAQSQSVEIIANNLANSDTSGFKKDMPTFKEYLATVEREHGTVDIPRGPITNRELYPLDGKDQAFVVVDGTYTNFRSGTLKVTQNPLDIAMDGPGFIEVSTPAGPRFTRQGSLKVAADGRLVTSEGNPVLASGPQGVADTTGPRAPASTGLGLAGPPPGEDAARFINLRDKAGPLSIAGNGEIYAGEELVAKLSVVEFQDPNKLRKVGSALFVNVDPANAAPAAKTQVRQGVIETSNVNPIEEMTKLIQANRLFEQDLKSMKTYNEMLAREANDLGKL